VQLLLEHGVDVNARDELDMAPSQPEYALDQEMAHLQYILSEYGAKPVE
jgi:hypothetical protein